MKSIRLSLIVYFLVLIALSLGGVSTLVYQTVQATLIEKQASTEQLVERQFESRCEAAKATLDQHLGDRVRLLAIKARWSPMPQQQKAHFAAIAFSHMTSPTGRFFGPWWLDEKTSSQFSYRLWQGAALEIHVPGADDYVSIGDDHPQEFFQTYRKNGAPVQRSLSLKDSWFTLSDTAREAAEEWREEFDDLNVNGMTLRRVTMKTRVTASTMMPFSPRPFFPGNKSKNSAAKGQQSKGSNKGPGGQPQQFQPRPVDQNSPILFIQYAADTALLEEQISGFDNQRELRLAQVRNATQNALASVSRNLLWIGFLTFAAIVAGGYVLLRLGLAPLARLSDAVSKVSERNFELQVDVRKLPSELRPIADRLRQSLEELQKAFAYEKQASADISHELRTPLAALMTTLDVALRKKRTPEEYRDVLEECRASGKHMSHLVERLMALARLDAGVERIELEPVDVGDLAQQCGDMVRSLAEEQGLELHTRVAEPLTTETDAGKLREIVLNLLHNAIAYNKPRGSIDLAVERVDGMVQIGVRDTGIGIAPDARAHLFERFFRADPSRHADEPHCGLGLAIVKSYVDLLGGAIDVDSSPAGSTFTVRLPLRADKTTVPFEIETEMPTAASM